MNSVTPSRRPSACDPRGQLGAAGATGRAAPRKLCTAGRGRSVGSSSSGGSARELLAPVGELRLQHLALQPLALPDREVRVLHRQLRQRRRPALAAEAA